MTLNITPYEYSVGLISPDGDALLLEESDQRQLLAWFAREKPQMVREAMGLDKVIEDLEKEKATQEIILKEPMGKHHTEIHQYIVCTLEYAIALLKGEAGCE